MRLNNIFSRTAMVTVLFLYFCLRTQVQCREEPSIPDSDYLTIKQSVTKAVPRCATSPEEQSIPAIFTTHPEVIVPSPTQQISPAVVRSSTGILCYSGCFGERSPPSC